MLRLLLSLMLLFGFAACRTAPDDEPLARNSATWRVDGALDFVRPDGSVIRTVDLEIAADAESRRVGLMNRRQITDDQAMLFVFDAPDMQSFWMANTPLPLDIIFVDADSQVVNIARRTKPLSHERVNSTGPAKYVVEVRGGFADRYGLTDSTRIRWTAN